MTFNIAQMYTQLLSWSCNSCNKYLKYIVDTVSELNGCYIQYAGDDIERSDLSIIMLYLHPVDL